jgi:molybdopterin synthase sulfur carrier subunit
MARIKIKVFGKIAEIMGSDEMDRQFHGNSEELILSLKENYPELKTFQFNVAINKSITANSVPLNDDDEIALLPPFSGG